MKGKWKHCISGIISAVILTCLVTPALTVRAQEMKPVAEETDEIVFMEPDGFSAVPEVIEAPGTTVVEAVPVEVIDVEEIPVEVDAAEETVTVQNYDAALPVATGLKWNGAGVLEYTVPETDAFIFVGLEVNGIINTTYHMGKQAAGKYTLQCQTHFSESGNYRFRVKTGTNDRDYDFTTGSVSAWSKTYQYKLPSEVLSTPKNARWSSTEAGVALWDAPKDMDVILEVALYKNGKRVGSSTTSGLMSSFDFLNRLKTDPVTDAKWSFTVRAYHRNPGLKACSAESARSTGLKVGEMLSGKWIKAANGKWWYKNADGSYPKNAWKKIDGKWYYFDKDGWMQTGWIKVGGKWYYMNSSGVMQTGWVKVSGKWYYMNGSGVMQTGWVKVSGKWYYMNSSGVMQTGWVKAGTAWYYLDPTSGVMKTGWLKDGTKWYYLKPSGTMATGTVEIDGKEYTFDNNGVWIKDPVPSMQDQLNTKYQKQFKQIYDDLIAAGGADVFGKRFDQWTHAGLSEYIRQTGEYISTSSSGQQTYNLGSIIQTDSYIGSGDISDDWVRVTASCGAIGNIEFSVSNRALNGEERVYRSLNRGRINNYQQTPKDWFMYCFNGDEFFKYYGIEEIEQLLLGDHFRETPASSIEDIIETRSSFYAKTGSDGEGIRISYTNYKDGHSEIRLFTSKEIGQGWKSYQLSYKDYGSFESSTFDVNEGVALTE